MNCNEEYIKLLEIVKKSMKETDNTKAETAIAKKLGKNTSFITDKKKSVKGYSAEDVLWLRYTFRDILGFPINEGQKEDSKNGVQGINQDEQLSLIDLALTQNSIQRRLDVIMEELALIRSGGDVKKAAELKKAMDTRTVLKEKGSPRKGNVTDGHTAGT